MTRNSSNTSVIWLEQFDFHLYEDQSHFLEINLHETEWKGSLGRDESEIRQQFVQDGGILQRPKPRPFHQSPVSTGQRQEDQRGRTQFQGLSCPSDTSETVSLSKCYTALHLPLHSFTFTFTFTIFY